MSIEIELLQNYCIIYNLECGYAYGVFRIKDVDELIEHYNIEEYPEAFSIENIEIRDYEVLERIMSNLGISKK